MAPDLRGHGRAAAVRPISFTACVEDVAALAPERFVLCGYSLGGRIALHVALALGERVSKLVLVSAGAGIENDGERAERRAVDGALASRIERAGIEEFIDYWSEQPLFAGDPEHVQAEVSAEARRNTPDGLAAALRGIGQGLMPPLWDRLGELEMPVAALAGERDRRYVALAERLAQELPGGRAVVVPGAGHRLALESPDAVAAAIVT